ncbi:MarR family winged helix-turn-helix transcriptional regulator [Nocardia sp. NPDC050378]|uniref:MarR family winged helix-turn-helix transcriptional regulator n=1 Tax=Nocardia sp. NPDC050378 TaxID=3155400 RepID=UPI0033FECF3A
MDDVERKHESADADNKSAHIGGALSLLAHVLTRLEDRLLNKELGLSYRQVRILKHVRDGVTSGTELGRIFCVTPSAISENLESLVQKGLLAREPHGSDRRAVRLALTEQGHQLNVAAQHAERALMTQVLAPLNENEVEGLMQIVTKLLGPSQDLQVKGALPDLSIPARTGS